MVYLDCIYKFSSSKANIGLVNKHEIKKLTLINSSLSRIEVNAEKILVFFNKSFFNHSSYSEYKSFSYIFCISKIVDGIYGSSKMGHKSTFLKRRFPPKRKYIFISYHPSDMLLARQLMTVLHYGLDSMFYRTKIANFNDDIETSLIQISCSDLFVPIVTSNYQNSFNGLVKIHLLKAISVSKFKSDFWIIPFIRTSVCDTMVRGFIERYLSFVLFEQESIICRSKQICSLFNTVLQSGRIIY